MASCTVLPGFYGVIVQFVLGICSFSVLVVKFIRDPAGRSLKRFALDSSKQLVGQGWCHILNLTFAMVIASFSGAEDECEVYWKQIMLDTTLGVGAEFCFLRGLSAVVSWRCGHEASRGLASGEYFDNDNQRFLVRAYSLQLAAWLLVVSCMKVSMLGIMWAFNAWLHALASAILAPVIDKPHLKLLVVMIFTPALMNSLQFWLTDNIFVHAQRSPDPMLAASARDVCVDQGEAEEDACAGTCTGVKEDEGASPTGRRLGGA